MAGLQPLSTRAFGPRLRRLTALTALATRPLIATKRSTVRCGQSVCKCHAEKFRSAIFARILTAVYIVNCNADLVEVTRTMSLDWIRFAQQHFEHGFAYARRMSDESVRMADELTRIDVTEWTGHGWVQRAA